MSFQCGMFEDLELANRLNDVLHFGNNRHLLGRQHRQRTYQYVSLIFCLVTVYVWTQPPAVPLQPRFTGQCFCFSIFTAIPRVQVPWSPIFECIICFAPNNIFVSDRFDTRPSHSLFVLVLFLRFRRGVTLETTPPCPTHRSSDFNVE